MKRPGVAVIAGVISVSIALPAGLSAQQQDAYPSTLHWGSGLINSPVAWVSPRNADIRISASGKEIPYAPDPDDMSFATRWNTNIALETHWLGRFTVGVAAYSQNPEYGFFGRLLLIKNDQFWRLPAVAVGVRNVGPYEHEERYLIGHDIELDPSCNCYQEIVPFYNDEFDTSPSFYAAATKDFILATDVAGFTVTNLGFNIGWGNGIFSDDGGNGEAYNKSGTVAEGLFFGARVLTAPSPDTRLAFVAENDAWDWNVGVVGDWRGLSLGVYASELEEGSRPEPPPNGQSIYNYRKWNVSLGYSGNIIDISRGVILRGRITELMREQTRLRAEIEQRNRRIRGLEAALLRAQAGELAEIERRRQELESQVREEREAIRRAMERLEEIQQGRQPTPPPSNPPTR